MGEWTPEQFELHPNTKWTPERLEVLKKYIEEGLSAGDIARELNESRNSVIGAIHRHLGSMTDLAPKKDKKRKVKAPVFFKKKLPPIQLFGADLVCEPAEFGEATLEEQEAGVSILQLNSCTCRWPLGSFLQRPPYRYCGEEITPGSAYCADHTAIAHAPWPGKRMGASVFK